MIPVLHDSNLFLFPYGLAQYNGLSPENTDSKNIENLKLLLYCVITENKCPKMKDTKKQYYTQ